MNRLLAALLLLSLAWPGGAHAAASCSLTTVGNSLLTFGNYDAMRGPVDAIGQVAFVCVPDLLSGPTVSYAVSASAGLGASFSPRKLMSGASALEYNMFLDPSHTLVFGDGSAGTAKSAGVCAAACVVTVYGRIFPGQVVSSGNYRDDILVTLEF